MAQTNDAPYDRMLCAQVYEKSIGCIVTIL